MTAEGILTIAAAVIAVLGVGLTFVSFFFKTNQSKSFIKARLALLTGAVALLVGVAGVYYLYYGEGLSSVPPPQASEKKWQEADEKGNPYSLVWEVDPACKNISVIDAKHQCHFVQTQTSFPGDNTPYDQWNLSLQAPGPVYAVTCEPTGSHEFNEVKGQVVGQIEGNVAVCRGWINGGDAPIRMTVKYKMQR